MHGSGPPGGSAASGPRMSGGPGAPRPPGWAAPPPRRRAGAAGVSRQTISQIERGDYSPSVTLALKLAKICGVRVEDIFVYQEDEPHE